MSSRTYVEVIAAGKNRGEIGIIAGTLAERNAQGITKAFVRFPQLAYPRDHVTILVKCLREVSEATAILKGCTNGTP